MGDDMNRHARREKAALRAKGKAKDTPLIARRRNTRTGRHATKPDPSPFPDAGRFERSAIYHQAVRGRRAPPQAELAEVLHLLNPSMGHFVTTVGGRPLFVVKMSGGKLYVTTWTAVGILN